MIKPWNHFHKLKVRVASHIHVLSDKFSDYPTLLLRTYYYLFVAREKKYRAKVFVYNIRATNEQTKKLEYNQQNY